MELALLHSLLPVDTLVCKDIIKEGYAGTRGLDLLFLAPNAMCLESTPSRRSPAHQGAICGLRRPATVISLAIAAGLTVMMWKRYQRTQKIVPAGLTAVLSLVMVCFYVWNLLLFTPPTKRQSTM